MTTPVLFVNFGEDHVSGQERVLLDLVTGLDPSRFTPVVWCNSRRLAQACTEVGVTVHETQFEFYFDFSSPRFSPRRYLSFVGEALRLIRSHKIRVIHANGAAPVQWLAPARLISGCSLVLHLHTRYLRRSRYVLLAHAVDHAVGVSRQVTEGLLEDGMPADRVEVIHNGFDPARASTSDRDLRSELQIPADAFVVCSLGTLVPRKGFDTLMRSVASLPDSVQLLIAGDGPLRKPLEQLRAELGLEKRVHFLGRTEDVMAVYRASNAFALASLQEGLPLVAIEAAYAGLPVVATSVGGNPEAVLDGVSGLLVPPGDHEALSAALHRFLADPELCIRMGNAGRQNALARFNMKQMLSKFEDLYIALSGPGRRLPLAARLRPYIRLVRPGTSFRSN
ncbi:glycosyltransferase family 4 protein [Roseomonas sp. SSH11]|uniref:Glycosyltransferase family 4 protein n=1 Tax=Pararoseomonas baculiformis TaxID=2820812 RepID=A0ABS4ADN4_9PROT|nr:glycosyltransferase family 4 protein [Pararoseomonas baculiformis]MBP0445129.1 glycosyltransferase family 4 protein [Pararoseomonas baculiformis]